MRSLWVAGLLLLTACTTWQPVAVHGGLSGNVAVGDRVTVTLGNGGQVTGKVSQVQADALTIDQRRIALSEMRGLAVDRVSGGQTADAVAGGAGAFLGGVALATGVVIILLLVLGG
jgi:hypothetical protein